MSKTWHKLTSQLIDTHCHVHHYENPQLLIDQLIEKKIRVHMVGVRPNEFQKCIELTRKAPLIEPCLGLFPLFVKEEQQNLPLFFELLKTTRFIGEIGLDYSIDDKEEVKLQKETFENIISACDYSGNKILSIHSRRSAEDVLAIIGNSFRGTAIMHWFSGCDKLVESTPDNIFYSINTAMLKSRSGKELIRKINPRQILTETDGPYIHNGKTRPAVPQDIRIVIESLSKIWQLTLEETLRLIENNYQRATTPS
ncbi:MAG: TatD family hydrolase [Lentisphaeraceae bacterium]|nr:TatD family hydrolase [Lentisphaeraceae bacterium]